jgi:hypothetical protein
MMFAMLTKLLHSPYSKCMKKYKIILLFGFCAVLLSVFSACGPKDGRTTETITTSTTPGPQSVSLVTGEVSVDAETNYVTTFTVDANMTEVTVEGNFRTVDGRPNIEVYIMDDATYTAWLRGTNVSTILYDSEKKSVGFINQSIKVPGQYHLIFTNWSAASYTPSQKVTVNFDLKWTY